VVGSLDVHGAAIDGPERFPEGTPERVTVRLKIPLVLSGRPSGPSADLREVDFVTDRVNFVRLILADEVDHVPQRTLIVVRNLHVRQDDYSLQGFSF
jgi:hypothetical protein